MRKYIFDADCGSLPVTITLTFDVNYILMIMTTARLEEHPAQRRQDFHLALSRDQVADFEIDDGADGEFVRVIWARARGTKRCEAAASIAAFRQTIALMEITLVPRVFALFERELLDSALDQSA